MGPGGNTSEFLQVVICLLALQRNPLVTYIGIDYSGAETPGSSLKGLRVYEASRNSLPVKVEPPPSPRKCWTRRCIAEWLVERLSEDVHAITGIDHGFSFFIHNVYRKWTQCRKPPLSIEYGNCICAFLFLHRHICNPRCLQQQSPHHF